MNATNVLERVPIQTDAHGVVRVVGTRVTLDTIVDAFATGATAEEIAQQYPTIPLVDVCSVIVSGARSIVGARMRTEGSDTRSTTTVETND